LKEDEILKMKIKCIGKCNSSTAYVVEVPPQKRTLLATGPKGSTKTYYVSLPKLYFVIRLFKGSYHSLSVFTSKEENFTLETKLSTLSFPNRLDLSGTICLGHIHFLSRSYGKMIEETINAFYTNRFTRIGSLSRWAKNTKESPNYVVKGNSFKRTLKEILFQTNGQVYTWELQ
jgi:hypothetical protein